jgi:hypothetical protein
MSTTLIDETVSDGLAGARHLPESLRSLIDARLDTIERMLLGRVSRPDRLAIVRDVEGQIHEMLASRLGDGTADPDRDTVLGVLADLDPPEAYLPEDGPGGAVGQGRLPVRLVPASALARSRRSGPVPAASDNKQKLALWSGILGIVSLLGGLGFAPLIYLLAVMVGGEILLVIGLPIAFFFTFLTAVLAVTFAGITRLRGSMAITGLVCGGFALAISLLGTVILLILLLSSA